MRASKQMGCFGIGRICALAIPRLFRWRWSSSPQCYTSQTHITAAWRIGREGLSSGLGRGAPGLQEDGDVTINHESAHQKLPGTG